MERSTCVPAANPDEGDRYIVPSGVTGAWAGRKDQIAAGIDGAWEYHAPKVGWVCFIAAEDKLAVYKTGGWSAGIPV